MTFWQTVVSGCVAAALIVAGVVVCVGLGAALLVAGAMLLVATVLLYDPATKTKAKP